MDLPSTLTVPCVTDDIGVIKRWTRLPSGEPEPSLPAPGVEPAGMATKAVALHQIRAPIAILRLLNFMDNPLKSNQCAQDARLRTSRLKITYMGNSTTSAISHHFSSFLISQ